jgi:integrase
MRRTAGSGTVDRLPSGRWRVRITLVDGTRRPMGPYNTEEEAIAMRDAALRELAAGSVASVGGVTLRAWGARWFAERELSGDVRAVAGERNRWKTHIETAAFIDWLVASIEPVHVAQLVAELRQKLVATPHMGERERRKLSRKTIKEIVSLLRLCLDGAIAVGVIRENPVARIKIKRQRRTHEPWTYLLPEEQTALKCCEAIPEPDGLLIRFALLTGLRLGEMFNTKIEDLFLDEPRPYLIVRYGSKDDATKSDRVRRVYLFDEADLPDEMAQSVRSSLPRPTRSSSWKRETSPHDPRDRGQAA